MAKNKGKKKFKNAIKSLVSAFFGLVIFLHAIPASAASSSYKGPSGAPLPTEIKSTTHPVAETWYNNNAPHIYWQLTSTVTRSSFAFTKEINTDPGTASNALASSTDYANIADGEWYFHLRIGNAKGWSSTSHRKFRIDTHAPENLKVSIVSSTTGAEKPSLFVTASDTLSGVDHYDLVVGETAITGIKPNDISETKPYTLPLQEPGTHNLAVKVFDAAGNNATTSLSFNVSPLEAPRISEFPSELYENDILTVKGRSYPSSDVTVYMQRDDEGVVSQIIRSTDSGAFTFTAPEKVKRGIYKLWAKVVRSDGSSSADGSKVTVSVKAQVALVLGEKTINVLATLVIIIALVVLMVLLYLYAQKKIRNYRNRVLTDVEFTKGKVDEVLKKMHENEIGIIQILEKAMLSRQLTPEEEEILTRLRYESQDQEVIDKDLTALEEDVKK